MLMMFAGLRRGISIHAPREGSDICTQPRCVKGLEISIHAPREGSDHHAIIPNTNWDISIHAPREGSDVPLSQLVTVEAISIHAPREGSDLNLFLSF